MENSSEPISLASFIFGNIDESGQLDTDILDNDAKKHLNSLTQLGLGSFVDELIGDEIPRGRSESQSGSDSDDTDHHTQEDSQGILCQKLFKNLIFCRL